MTGTCRWGTCEEGKTLHSAQPVWRERAGMDRQRRGMFTESEPEEQTESTTCSFPTLLFAACPHTRVNRQLIETAPHTFLFVPLFISSFIFKPLALKQQQDWACDAAYFGQWTFFLLCSDRMKQCLTRTMLAKFCSILSTTAVKRPTQLSPPRSKHVSLHSRK